VEESILARAQYKLDIDGKVIQAGKFDNRSTEEDREAFLVSCIIHCILPTTDRVTNCRAYSDHSLKIRMNKTMLKQKMMVWMMKNST
jgi:hypothetical protein